MNNIHNMYTSLERKSHIGMNIKYRDDCIHTYRYNMIHYIRTHNTLYTNEILYILACVWLRNKIYDDAR